MLSIIILPSSGSGWWHSRRDSSAGPGANAETQELARLVAEAQIELRRVRYARHQFLSDTLSNQNYALANMRMKVKILGALLRPNPPAISRKP